MSTKGQRGTSGQYTKEELREMLFWWVYYKRNNKKAAREVQNRLGRVVTAKTIKKVSLRENFDAKAPFVQSAIEVFKYGGDIEKTPEDLKLNEMGLNLMTIDAMIVRKAKAYIAGKDSKLFRNVKEAVDALRFVSENVENLIGETNMRKSAWDYSKQLEGSQISETAEAILSSLKPSQANMIVNDLEQKIIKGEL